MARIERLHELQAWELRLLLYHNKRRSTEPSAKDCGLTELEALAVKVELRQRDNPDLDPAVYQRH